MCELFMKPFLKLTSLMDYYSATGLKSLVHSCGRQKYCKREFEVIQYYNINIWLHLRVVWDILSGKYRAGNKRPSGQHMGNIFKKKNSTHWVWATCNPTLPKTKQKKKKQNKTKQKQKKHPHKGELVWELGKNTQKNSKLVQARRVWAFSYESKLICVESSCNQNSTPAFHTPIAHYVVLCCARVWLQLTNCINAPWHWYLLLQKGQNIASWIIQHQFKMSDLTLSVWYCANFRCPRFRQSENLLR